jgi:hypothetical protein
MFIPDPDLDFLPTPDPGVKKSTVFRIRICNTFWGERLSFLLGFERSDLDPYPVQSLGVPVPGYPVTG